MYTLDNAHELNKLSPDSFYIPSFKEIENIKTGALVKLIFREDDIQEGMNVERMWVIVTNKTVKGKEIYFEGTLDNDPYYLKSVQYQDIINFSNKHIIQID